MYTTLRMGRNKDLRKRIAGLQRVIAKHEEKLKQELARPYPDKGLIELWRKQIAGYRAQIERLQRRLKRKP